MRVLQVWPPPPCLHIEGICQRPQASSGFLLPRSCISGASESLAAGKMRSPGLVNFVTALAYHICL